MSSHPYADVLRRDLFNDPEPTAAPERARQIHPATKPKGKSEETLAAVIELVADGLTNHQIADELGLQTETVAGYVSTAYQQAGISTRKVGTKRVQLALWHLKRTGRLA